MEDDTYGPDDECQACGILAVECGHVRPEQEKDTRLPGQRGGRKR